MKKPTKEELGSQYKKQLNYNFKEKNKNSLNVRRATCTCLFAEFGLTAAPATDFQLENHTRGIDRLNSRTIK